MTYDEPTTAAEVLERARAAHARRWGHPAPSPSTVLADRAREARERQAAAISAQMAAANAILSAQMSAANAMLADDSNLVAPARVKHIIQTVALEYQVSVSEIVGKRRTGHIVSARHEAIRRVARETGWSLPRIGKVFNRDYTTVLHALDPAKRKAKNDYKRAWASA